MEYERVKRDTAMRWVGGGMGKLLQLHLFIERGKITKS